MAGHFADTNAFIKFKIEQLGDERIYAETPSKLFVVCDNAKYSVGGGLAEGSQSLRDFYLDLAKQATPVIEVGATKKITVVISEGKDLEIKEKEGETLQKRL